MVPIDPRLKEIHDYLDRLKIRPVDLYSSYKSVESEYAKPSLNAFYRYLSENPPRTLKPWVNDVISFIRSRPGKLSTSMTAHENSRRLYGNMAFNDNPIGFSKNEIGHLFETIPAQIDVVNVKGIPWVKGISEVTYRVSALLGAASEHILLNGDLGYIKSGTLVSFFPTENSDENIYLMFQRRDDENERLIGWISSSHPTQITVHGTDQRYDLSAWRVIAYAVCLSRGVGNVFDKLHINTRGISPDDRLLSFTAN